jgi:hypothetical protein
VRLVSIGVGPIRFTGPGALLLWVVGWLLVGVARLIYAAASHPRTTLVVLGSAIAARFVTTHPAGSALLGAAVMVAGEVWHLLAPASFRRQVTLRTLTAARSTRYRARWQAAMYAAELDRDGRLPRLARVRCLDVVDVLRVRALLGQRFADWEAAAPMVAHVLGATDVRVHRGDDRRLTLELGRGRRGRSWDRGGILDL